MDKTTFSGTLARLLVHDGYDVLTIDADAGMNISSALGVDHPPRPLTDCEKMIDERAEKDER